jgi:hypothetical protein
MNSQEYFKHHQEQNLKTLPNNLSEQAKFFLENEQLCQELQDDSLNKMISNILTKGVAPEPKELQNILLSRIGLLDDIFDEIPSLKEPIIVYKGVKEVSDKLFKTYSHVTRDLNTAKIYGKYILKITVPHTSKILPMVTSDIDELLLNRGKIHMMYEEKQDKYTIINCIYLPEKVIPEIKEIIKLETPWDDFFSYYQTLYDIDLDIFSKDFNLSNEAKSMLQNFLEHGYY